MPAVFPIEELRARGIARGDLVALALAPGVGVAMVAPAGAVCVAATDEHPAIAVRRVEQSLRPRWVMWSNATASALVDAGVRVATSWDIAAVHRLILGGWHADPARVWAQLHDLKVDDIPRAGPVDLFSHAASGDGDPEEPVRPDGYLRPDWVDGEWSTSVARLAHWAELALEVAGLQQVRLHSALDPARAAMTARARSRPRSCCVPSSRPTVCRWTGPSPRR